jgi:GNAT superfamily N-acetyltransferase
MSPTRYLISEFQSENVNDILNAIGADPNWDIFTKNHTEREKYKNLLNNSPVFVCYLGNEFCGYIRAILDQNFAVYISELYVTFDHRNQKVAEQLINKVKEAFSELTVYVLSDEDAFYEKKGYKNVGSVFEI